MLRMELLGAFRQLQCIYILVRRFCIRNNLDHGLLRIEYQASTQKIEQKLGGLLQAPILPFSATCDGYYCNSYIYSFRLDCAHLVLLWFV